MPGLSGNANGPVGKAPILLKQLALITATIMLIPADQATCSRAPSTTAASSRMQPSWSGSSSILKLRYTPRLGSAATSWLGYIDTQSQDETWFGHSRMGYKIVTKGIGLHFLSGCRHTSITVAEIVLHIWFVGLEGLLIATTTWLVFTLV